MKEFFSTNRIYFIFLMKTLIIASSLVIAFVLRFDFSFPDPYRSRIVALLPAALIIKLIVFRFLGLFRGWWRYVSMPDLVRMLEANIIASLLFIFYAVVVYRLEQIPRSVLILDGLLCFMFMAGVRFATRAYREQFLPRRGRHRKSDKRVLVVGAGEAGQSIVRELRSNPQLNMILIGFVDDDPHKQNTLIHGFKVLGTQSDLTEIISEEKVDEVIIAIPSATGSQVRAIVDRCRTLNVNFRTLPRMADLIDGSVSVQQLRDVDLDDLLGREAIHLDEAEINSYLEGKRVLVTGAGGSIGSELCRQVARFNPAKLILFENAETPLFKIEQELSQAFPYLKIVPIIGDVRNRSRVNVIFDEQMPQVVFHAAAYKHVPMMESNPAEAVNNNVQGTRLVADAADHFNVEKFVMVSTDKAVRPTNIMGASKRVAELYVQSLNKRSKTNYVTTRFGNVLGSNGSVIPTFREQIAKGGPVTVTHPEVTRFFMTIPEATQLVLQAGSMGNGGEIYLFDMGEAVKIQNLAEDLIKLSGFQPFEDIEIVYTGLRPGEKLYEELLLDDEGVLPTSHDQICIARSVPSKHNQLVAEIDKLIAVAKELDLEGVRRQFGHLVPEYRPSDNRTPAKVIAHPAAVGDVNE